MLTLTEEEIEEIAEQLDCGIRSFWHKTTRELLFVPDIDENPFIDIEFFEDDFEKLNQNLDDYIEIRKPNSSDSFRIMDGFA